jgi:hypothetical protein
MAERVRHLSSSLSTFCLLSGVCRFQLEDDVAIIASRIGWAPLTAGSSIATARMLTGTVVSSTVSTATANGIALPGTPSVYGFKATQGLATVVVSGVAPWVAGLPQTNVDLQMNITDSAGNILRNINPTDTTAIPATSLVLPVDGTYYVWLAGTGLGSSYSSYASMGAFKLDVEYPTGVNGQFSAGAARYVSWSAEPPACSHGSVHALQTSRAHDNSSPLLRMQ